MSFSRRGFMGVLAGVSASLFGLKAKAAPVAAPAKRSLGLTTINASNQTGHNLIINPAHRDFPMGTVITINGVDAFDSHPSSFPPNVGLRRFVLTRNVAKGEWIMSIYPPILPRRLSENCPIPEKPHFEFATVDVCPKNNAVINVFSEATLDSVTLADMRS